MPGYETRQEHVAIGGHDYCLRVLADRQQFWDPDGHGERLGISSAQWALFGQLWPAGQLLARAMEDFDIGAKRILELGCGIGLASLVLQRRGADVVASDMHPLAEVFLAYNAALNGLPALHYRHLQWDEPLPELGRFDLIIASDVLYESEHAALLGGVVDRHAHPNAEVLVADPGRGNASHLNRQLAARGFGLDERRCTLDGDEVRRHRGRLLHYTRGLPGGQA
ncbi:Methyltransferase type 12 [Pseudoxanthomonas suwonensis 11-1]|uniref:Methyltransferase type 12 n=1 Tax=Pseudoxanthomonas suwonensis (strain 11-1) TaxID=743721 RepID=E6WPH8_PSEUU|nr:methyltransferase domain-containing protein [Pseudoxanthomonas suwonensis]ADV26222.1 Methyltransferase type 12 [Pseudoxanthomonas suwonensis 11-1]